MNKVRKSYSVAKTKNLARIDSLLKNDEKSTILFVSKYGSIKQGFLNDYINDNIKDETLVMNFMYFSELYNDGKSFDIGSHFEKQLNIYKAHVEADQPVKIEEKVEEVVEEEDEATTQKKPRVFESAMLIVDGIVIIFLNLFVLSKTDISDYISFFDGKQKLFEYIVYAIGALFILFGIIVFAVSSSKPKKKKKKVAKEKVKKEKPAKKEKPSKKEKPVKKEESAAKNVKDEFMALKQHTITQRDTDTKNLHQTQSLDFRQMLGKEGNDYEFDLSGTDKKYFVLYGLDEYVNFVKTKSTNSEELIKQVSDFMIKVYSTFKKYNDRKLIFVWKDKVFINQDLTLLIFDEIFTLYGDFDEIELKNHAISTFESYGYNVNEEMCDTICDNVNYLSDIDIIVKEMNGISQFVDIEIDANKLAYIQFLNLLDEKKIEALKTHFASSDRMVDLKLFTLSKSEFELYLSGTPKIVEEDSTSVEADNDFLEYADIMIDTSVDVTNYKVTDDFDKLFDFADSVPEKDLHFFINLDILDNFLKGGDQKELLGEKIIFSLLNADEEIFQTKFKSLFNALAKSSVSEGSQDYSKIVEIIIMIMLAVERKKKIECMYEVPEKYIKNNRKPAIMMVRHINKKIGDFQVFRNNEMLINYLLKEAIPTKTEG